MMTTKQKAKRFDEALKIAKKNYVTAQDLSDDSKIGVECFKNTLEGIFPELKESEDEKIRKWLIDTIKQIPDSSIEWENISKSDILAWLEKQGENESGPRYKYLFEKQGEQKHTSWSEEDKGNLLDVKCVIDEVWGNQYVREEIGYSAEELESLWHWLDNIWQRVEYPQNS